MATVTKRTWKNRFGETKTAWVCSYIDRSGKQHRKQFEIKRDAETERVRIEGEIARGVHVPDRSSITVNDAAKAFLADFEELVQAKKRELSTFRGYEQHVRLHISPKEISNIKLSRLTGPDSVEFSRELERKLSTALAIKVLSTLKSIIRFSNLMGWMSHNPVIGVSIRTAGDRNNSDELDIPTKKNLKDLLNAAKAFDNTGRAEALVSILLFGGLRISELRGLRRHDLELENSCVRVRQRADKWQRIGQVKTKNARRVVPLPKHTIQTLKHWLLASPHSHLDLVFPTGVGNPESYANIYNRLWRPLMLDAGMATVTKRPDKTKHIKPHFGLHALRHSAVSLWIEQGVSPKKVMTWAGHASIQFSMDTYGHLWEDAEGDAAIAEAVEKSILG